MPSKGSKGNRSKKTAAYRQMLENTETLCKSQVFNELYEKLKSEGRLSRFIATVQYCSMSGLNINDAVDVIIKAFPGYISEKEFTVDCFNDMLQNYSDIAVAWGYGTLGDEISNIIIKNKALRLIEKTDKMEDIEIYSRVFNGIGNSGKEESSSNGTVINFNLKK
jgi:hypothetical protein